MARPKRRQIYKNGIAYWPCSRCKSLTPESEFHKSAKAFNGLSCYCKPCQSERAKESAKPRIFRPVELLKREVYKDRRNAGFYFHKGGFRTGIAKTKQWALDDITKECGEGQFFSRNYIHSEKNVLMLWQYDFKYITI